MDNIKITIETNAEDAARSFEDLAKAFSDTDKQAVDLRKEIKDMKKDLYALTPGTEEYAQKIQELGAKMNQLGDTQRQLRAATGGLDTVFQSSTTALSDLASGFQAAMGVTALFGKNAEDLQKTFVKLQAIMSITTGLKGLAAFPKHMKDAAYSIKAYTASLKLATNSTNVFTAATKKMGAALVSNPWVAALAVLAAAFAYTASEQKKATEIQERYNQAIGAAPEPIKDAKEQLDDYLESLENYDQRLQTLGISEERRREIKLEGLKKEKEETEQLIEANKARIKELEDYIDSYQQSIEDQVDNFDELDVALATMPQAYEAQSMELKKLKVETADAADNVEKLAKEIVSLQNSINPPVLQSLNDSLSALSDEFTVKMAGGLATQGDYIQAQIDVYKKAQNELYKIVGSHNGGQVKVIKGETLKERNANKELATTWSANIHALQVQLDAYNAGVAKKNRDAAQSLAAKFKENYDEFIKSIQSEADKAKDEWKNILDSLDFETFSLLSPEERSGRISAQAFRFETEIETYLETWRKLAQNALKDKKITETQFNTFISSLDGIKEKLENSLNADIDINISEDIRNLGKSIQESIGKIKLDNESMLKALSAGLISKQEYQEWLVKTMEEYNGIANQVIETNNPTEAAFIAASKAIIPPEVKTQMENDIKEYYDDIIEQIDKEYEKLEKRYMTSREVFDSWVNDQNRSWLEGGTNTSYWGDTASQTYQKMQKQAEELYKLLHSEYEEEKRLLEEKMELLDKNSEAHSQYYEKLEELRQADLNAKHDYETASLANTRQYNQDVLQLHVKLADSLSGLAGAMGSYYAEQAEWAKETYGENSAEYEKYLQREGYMKKAQVWIDWASGVMSAWATSEQLGPIAGPIMAALQTAALTATALASVKTINRQAKISGDGGAANVSGITDRVVFGEAQSADQQAKLNAEYNQGASRVFVVESDINDAQKNTRTAVTSNTF